MLIILCQYYVISLKNYDILMQDVIIVIGDTVWSGKGLYENCLYFLLIFFINLKQL